MVKLQVKTIEKVVQFEGVNPPLAYSQKQLKPSLEKGGGFLLNS